MNGVELSQSSSFTYEFPASGTYTVCLILDDCGEECKEIVVERAAGDSLEGEEVDNRSNSQESTTTVTTAATMKVYPNPSNGLLNLELPTSMQEQAVQIDIFNLQGQLMTSKKHNSVMETLQLNLDDMKNGSYIIRVISNGESFTQSVQLIK